VTVGAASASSSASTPGGRLGDSAPRPDGIAKALGTFSFAGDITADGCLWGATLRSPHPHALIVSIDVSSALKMPGVHAVVTAADVPGSATYGLIISDQPVFAQGVVRFVGEPVAAVAADDPDLCRRALAAIVVEYEVLTPLTDPEKATDESVPSIHPAGNVVRHQRIVCGDQSIEGPVVVEGTYHLGRQDQAFLGLEAALAIPDPGGGGVEIHVATQWLHEDRRQMAACLALPDEEVRIVLAGVGGAFGAREDISLQIHCGLLALKTGRAVRMAYDRSESFVGHVHRHPATVFMRHHADHDGVIRRIEARFVLDGGPYASTSSAVLLNAVTHAQGPYRCPNATIDGWAVRTNNLPSGAMRGFGVVQACFAHERQMHKLAEACGLDQVEVRLRNAMRTGDRLITGQVMKSVAPVERIIREVAALRMPTEPVGVHARRGVGYAVSLKNLMYSEGFDDYAVARVRLADGVATVKFATAEVGQGFVTLAQQIARTVLGVEDVVLDRIDTLVGSGGSTSASRQTWMSGGAVDGACRLVRDRLLHLVAARHGMDLSRLAIEGTDIVETGGALRVPVSEASAGVEFDETFEHHHPATVHLDADGQGDCHTAFAFAAHRAVVDVDPELGVVKVVQVATSQDVGRALNPLAVVGQIEGGIAQGIGLALMEELVQIDGHVQNATFTDYLVPTFLDMPEVVISLVEEHEPLAPLGAKGVGEPPTISATPAVVAAICDALGIEVDRVPVRPADIYR